jgi:hypothetical protein
VSVSDDPRAQAWASWWRHKREAAEEAGCFPQPLILPDPDEPDGGSLPETDDPTGFSPAP